MEPGPNSSLESSLESGSMAPGSALRQQGYCKIRAPELEQVELVLETARKLAGAWNGEDILW